MFRVDVAFWAPGVSSAGCVFHVEQVSCRRTDGVHLAVVPRGTWPETRPVGSRFVRVPRGTLGIASARMAVVPRGTWPWVGPLASSFSAQPEVFHVEHWAHIATADPVVPRGT